MSKMPIKVLATGFLLVGLTACNMNNNAAPERGENLKNAMITKNGGYINEGLNTGNRGNRPYGTNVSYHNNGTAGVRDFAYNTRTNPRHNSSNELAGSMDNSISADFTTMNSGDFPHTRPVLIQEAKYGFVVGGQGQGAGQNINIPDIQSLTEQFARRFQAPGQIQQFMQQGQAPGFGAQGQPNVTQQRPVQQQPAPQAQPKVNQPQQQQQAQTAKPTPTKTQGISATEQRVIDLTNAERRKAGIKDFIGDAKLSSVARTKANDMQAKGYFSHTSPTYGSPFDMMRDFGITYKTAGENIAQGQQSPEEVVRSWMNSQGHRENILNPEFTHIGVGYNAAGKEWVQQFIGK